MPVDNTDLRCLDSTYCRVWCQVPDSVRALPEPGSFRFYGPYKWDTIVFVRSMCDYKGFNDSLQAGLLFPLPVWYTWAADPTEMYSWYLKANPLGKPQTDCK